MRRRQTTVLAGSAALLILLLCVLWGLLVQVAVPDACSYPEPPANARYLTCPADKP